MATRNYVSLLAFFFVVSATVFGQTKTEKTNQLFKIKQAYKKINADKSYKTVIIDDAEEFTGHNTDGGGKLTGYFRGDTLAKLIEWVGLSNKIIQNEYYFDNNKLIFVYSTEKRFPYSDSLQGLDYNKPAQVFAGRYYYKNQKLIDAILTDKEHKKTRQRDAQAYINESKRLSAIIKKKHK
jgi:hypothetical protein